MTSLPRRLFSFAGATVLALSLAACGESTTRGAASSTPAAASSSASGTGGAAAGLTLADVKAAGVIKVGTEGTYKPFSYHEGGGTGKLTGFDIEIMDAVAAKLGVKVEYSETQWDAIFAGLDAKRFDAIANQVSINPKRQESYLFSTPYTYSPGVVVVGKDTNDIKAMADLKGKTTAQSLSSNWYEMAKAAGANVQPVEGWAQAVTLLEQGRINATINDKLTFLDWQKSNGGTDKLKIAVTTDEVGKSAITFRKGSDDLVAAVDKALADLAADGTLTTISQKYFGADVTKP